MIKIQIITGKEAEGKGKQIATAYDDKDVTLNDVALVIYELERLKQELLKIEFKLDFDLGAET